MKRCFFLVLALSLQTGPLPAHATLLQSRLPDQNWQLGDYRLSWRAAEQAFAIDHGHHRLLHHPSGQAFVEALVAERQVHEQRGSFALNWKHLARCGQQSLEQAQWQGQQLVLQGRLSGDPRCDTSYQLTASLSPEGHLKLGLTLAASEVNGVQWRLARDPETAYHGLGAQPSQLDLRGKGFPLVVQEGGIGRGAQPLSALIDLASPGSAGHATSTYFPLPWLWSASGSALALEGSALGEVDLRTPGELRLLAEGTSHTLRLFAADSPLALLERYSAWAGRPPLLPDWLHKGLVVGMQGGTAKVWARWQELQQQGTPVAAFWLQDWVGRRQTAIGSQLWWNWERDLERYPDWESLRQSLQAKQVRLLGYVNPFLVDVAGRPHQRNLYREARDAGYLVQNPQGQPYPIQNTDFDAGLLDLSHPGARTWFKQVMRAQIQATGLAGWMADYAEALPLDARLYAGSADTWHNLYAVEWARLQSEILAENPEAVFFPRSGYTGSSGLAPLFWLGDQNVDWSPEDGLGSALTGLLSSGLSGIPVMHSDAGGYTSVSPGAGLGWRRSPELLCRWLEMNAWTAWLRTHEGNQPWVNAQSDSSALTRGCTDRAARIFAALFAYRRELLVEAHERGWPVVRHPLLHFPTDREAAALSDQFMLGADFWVAPILQPGQTRRRVYLPKGHWVELWSGRVRGTPHRGEWFEAEAPLGSPAVFYRLGSPAGAALRAQLQQLPLWPPP
ncbi:MAG: alpha-glucosidase [Candidatus Sericytochromatia bacterium]